MSKLAELAGLYGLGAHVKHKQRDTAAQLADLFALLVKGHGAAEAKRLWKKAGQLRRGRPRGSVKYDMAQLLTWLDEVKALPDWAPPISDERRITVVASFAHEKYRGEFGASLDGIAKSLRRALTKREQEKAAKTHALVETLARWNSDGTNMLARLAVSSLENAQTENAAEILSSDSNSRCP